MIANSSDAAALYASSRALLLGHDPYDHAVLARVWMDSGGPPNQVPKNELSPAVYTTSTYVIGWPLAALPWRWAKMVWFGVNLSAIAVMIDVLRRVLGLAWREPRTLLLAGFSIALRGTANCIEVGQLSILVTTLGCLAILLSACNRRETGGVLYGAAIAIKAPVAAVFFLPDFLVQRWKPLIISASVIIVLNAIGLLRLHEPSVSLEHWRANLQGSYARGAVNDPSPANPSRTQMIDLQYPLSSVISNPAVIEGILVPTALVLAAPALWALRKKPVGAGLLLPVACLCTVELLVMYHRAYDAILLVFALAWALLPTTPRWQAGPTLALLLVFILPGARPPSITQAQSWIGKFLITPRDTWTILAVGIWLASCQCLALLREDRQRMNEVALSGVAAA